MGFFYSYVSPHEIPDNTYRMQYGKLRRQQFDQG